MSIGIEFKLNASTSGFTKGIASANNSLEELKKNVRTGDLGGGIKRLLGAGAIIEGFRAIIDHAKETRAAFEEMGKPVPASVAGVAQLADAFSSLKKGALDAGVELLSVFTRIGEKAGDAAIKVGGVFGRQSIDPALGGAIEHAADLAEASRDKAKKAQAERNSRENLAKLQQRVDDSKKAADQVNESDSEKVNDLLAARIKLLEKESQLKKNPYADKASIDEAAAASNDNLKAVREAVKAVDEKKEGLQREKKDAEKALKDANEKVLDSKRDQFLPTIGDLAKEQIFNGASDPHTTAVKDARRFFDLQRQAHYSAQTGNLAGAIDLQGQAEKIRSGLSGFAKSDEVNQGREQVEAVDKATEQLKQVNDKLNGLYKAT